MNRNTLVVVFVCLCGTLLAQPTFTRLDTLRGTITPERSWWDLNYYHLNVAVDIDNRSISGSNSIYYTVVEENNIMQIDLQPPLKISRVMYEGMEMPVDHDGNAHFITLPEQNIGNQGMVEVFYSGVPVAAKRPPWDGGFDWKEDSNGKPFVATSCQGIGASIWWPNKDHGYDEPDSMLISVTVPRDLMNVSNGRLRKIDKNKDKTITTHWFVSNPLSNYVVNINIGDYVHWSEVYPGEKGSLDVDYWVLRENKKKAREQFKQVPMMLKAFEHWFGPYPFYADGFKLVEVPYLGMEHQSSITYGNKYANGYLGRDLSRTGWGLTFDFIIIHESGHEWFANNITASDIADMWIHESFTNYSENLYVEYYNGKDAGAEYIRGTRWDIRNDRPVQGIYGVHYRGSGDMYPKGGNMLHTLRQLVDDDEKWRNILRGLNEEFYHKTVDADQIEQYISQSSGLQLDYFFDQYLRDVRIPVLEFKKDGDKLHYRWNSCLETFAMPVRVELNGENLWLKPTTQWNTLNAGLEVKSVEVDPDFYIGSLDILGN